jgi:hypothetical protein
MSLRLGDFYEAHHLKNKVNTQKNFSCNLYYNVFLFEITQLLFLSDVR